MTLNFMTTSLSTSYLMEWSVGWMHTCTQKWAIHEDTHILYADTEIDRPKRVSLMCHASLRQPQLWTSILMWHMRWTFWEWLIWMKRCFRANLWRLLVNLCLFVELMCRHSNRFFDLKDKHVNRASSRRFSSDHGRCRVYSRKRTLL